MEEEYEYDDSQRMKYHEDFHPNQGKRFTEEELEYLCTFYEWEILRDHRRSMAFALGRTEQSIQMKIKTLRKSGLFWYYKNRGLYY